MLTSENERMMELQFYSEVVRRYPILFPFSYNLFIFIHSFTEFRVLPVVVTKSCLRSETELEN